MYTPRLEELESRNLLSTSISPHQFVMARSAEPSSMVTEYWTAPPTSGGNTVAPAQPEFMTAFARQAPLAEPAMLGPGPGSTGYGGGFAVVERFAEPQDIGTLPVGVEVHFRGSAPEAFLTQASSVVAVAAATETIDAVVTSGAVRISNPGSGLASAPDLLRPSVDPPPASVAQRLTLGPAPRLDTLVGFSAFRVDPQITAAVHTSGAWAVREPDGAAAASELAVVTPGSANPSPTLPQASEADSGAAEGKLTLPRPQGSGGALNLLPGIDIADVERGMQHFLKQLQGVRDDLVGKHDKPGLGVWLVAGTAAVAACEMARRQMWGLRKGQSSFRHMALEMNWIAGSPPDFPLGE